MQSGKKFLFFKEYGNLEYKFIFQWKSLFFYSCKEKYKLNSEVQGLKHGRVVQPE
jgi:hypothetical protein